MAYKNGKNHKYIRLAVNRFGEIHRYDSFRAYLSSIQDLTKFTKEERERLVLQVKKGNKVAMEKLVFAYLQLVIYFAKKYSGLNVSFMDLISEGNMGLVKAVSRLKNGFFDPSKGSFSTYAGEYIKGEIKRVLSDQSRLISLPASMIARTRKIDRLRSQFLMKNGIEPSDDELAFLMDIPVSKIAFARRQIPHVVWIEQRLCGVDGHELKLVDTLSDESQDTAKECLDSSDYKTLTSCLNFLSERQKVVIMMRLGFKPFDRVHTLEEVGSKFRASRERIRQIESRALRILRIKFNAASSSNHAVRMAHGF